MLHICIFSYSHFQHSLQANFPLIKHKLSSYIAQTTKKGEALVQFSPNRGLATEFRLHNILAVSSRT